MAQLRWKYIAPLPLVLLIISLPAFAVVREAPGWSIDLETRAESGDDDAQRIVALAYATGHGIKQDYAEAAKWYRKSSEQGDPDAESSYTQLAGLYAKGLGVRQDWQEAYFWYSLFDQTPLGQTLAYIPASGPKTLEAEASRHLSAMQIEEVKKRLVDWNPPPSKRQIEITNNFLNKAEAGDLQGYLYLGRNAEAGYPLKRNYKDAVKWYELAAERGAPLAQYRLGFLYFNGLGTSQDLAKAYFWLILASHDTNPYSITRKPALLHEAAHHLAADQKAAVERRAKDWKPMSTSVNLKR